MIGIKEKGLKGEKLKIIPKGLYEGIDLKALPNYICYKAALVKRYTLSFEVWYIVYGLKFYQL